MSQTPDLCLDESELRGLFVIKKSLQYRLLRNRFARQKLPWPDEKWREESLVFFVFDLIHVDDVFSSHALFAVDLEVDELRVARVVTTNTKATEAEVADLMLQKRRQKHE